jgi:hypothetical protein
MTRRISGSSRVPTRVYPYTENEKDLTARQVHDACDLRWGSNSTFKIMDADEMTGITRGFPYRPIGSNKT